MTATGCPKPAMRSVEFARRHGVNLHVRSSFTWEPGTWVTEEELSMEQAVISAVTSRRRPRPRSPSLGVPDQPGIAARLFRSLADQHVNVDMIVQNVSDHGRDRHLLHRAPRATSTWRSRRAGPSAAEIGAADVLTDEDIAKVSLIGAGMRSNPGVSAQHVRGPGRGRRQHRDDLDVGHPHHLRRAAPTGWRTPSWPSTRPSS